MQDPTPEPSRTNTAVAPLVEERDIRESSRKLFKRLILGLTGTILLGSSYFALRSYALKKEMAFAGLEETVHTWRNVRRDMGFVPYTEFGYDPFKPRDVENSPVFKDKFGNQLEAVARSWRSSPDIVFMGGSTAAGVGASCYENTFFRQFAEDTDLNCVSGGHYAYVDGQTISVLWSQVIEYNPKEVILLSGYNDVVIPAFEGLMPGYPLNYGLIKWQTENPENGFLIWLAKTDPVVKLGIDLLFGAKMNSGSYALDFAKSHVFSVKDEAILRVMEINLTAMSRICRGSGVQMSYVLQPNAWVIDDAISNSRYKNSIERVKYMKRMWPKVADRLRRTCQQEGVDFYDATYVVSPEHFQDPCHFNDNGQEELAAFLLDRLYLQN